MVFYEQMVAGFCLSNNIGWWVFAIAAIVALGIAFITVSFQAIKAAMSKSGEEFENGVKTPPNLP